MTDLTLEDLAGGSDDGGGSGGGGSGSGEWVTGLVDKLADRGLLEPLIVGPDNAELPSANTTADANTETENMDMDAEKLVQVGKKIYDNTGKIPGLSEDPSLSEIIKWVEQNPSLVDNALEQYL